MEISFRLVANALENPSLVNEAKSKALFQKAEDLRQRSKEQYDSPKNHSSRRPSRKKEWKTRTKTKKRIKSQTVVANEETQGDKAQREFQTYQAIEADEEVRTRKNVALVISEDERKPNVSEEPESDAFQREDDETPNASRERQDVAIEGKNEWKLKALCEVQIPLPEILMARKKYLQTLDPNQNSEGQQPIDAEQDELTIQPENIQLIEISDDENAEAPVEFSGRRWSSTLCQQCGTYVRCNI